MGVANLEELKISGYESLQLYGRHWSLESPKAVLLIVHGIGEHSGRYSGMAEYFNSRGIAVIGYDHRGHGLSEGKRGLLLSWKEFRGDLRAVDNEAVRLYPTLPLFILGQSLGGTMTLDYILSAEHAPRGVIISAPALGTPGISPFLLGIAKVLSAVTPRLTLSTALDSDSISRDPEECRKYREDPLVHDKASVKLASELTSVQESIFSRSENMNCPLLLCYGSEDRIAPHEPAEAFFKRSGSDDKELKIFEGAYHEIHNDIIREDVYKLYADWISNRI
ncbi:MAG: hypothetical protein DRZ90_12720 [Spirochaetes bacterium]|nr:MAG: hypothetical protein DRZ90_12720 [Spirochaetota bacterium]